MSDPPSTAEPPAGRNRVGSSVSGKLGCLTIVYICVPVPILLLLSPVLVAAYCVVAIWAVSRVSPGRENLVRLAMGALAACVVAVLLLICIAALPPHGPRPEARQRQCLRQLHNLGLAAAMFHNASALQWPDAANWCDTLLEKRYADGIGSFVCPNGLPEMGSSYAMNVHLSKLVGDVPPNTVLFFESDLGWNGAGGPDDLPAEPRHPDGHAVLFTDGTVRMVPPDDVGKLRWVVPSELRRVPRWARDLWDEAPEERSDGSSMPREQDE